MKRIGKAILVTLLFIVAVNVGVNVWLSWKAAPYLYTDIRQLPYSTFALVLGTVKYDDYGTEYQSYKYRINTAKQLYKAGKVKYLLVSSDNSREFGFNAATIKSDLVQKGVPADKIFVDTEGKRTIYSISRCKNIFNIDTVTIVSQARHCERALYLASYFGLTTVAYAAPSGDMQTHLGSIVHEQAARFVMLYDLYIRKRQ